MDRNLIINAIWDSGLLAGFFLGSSISDFTKKRNFWGVVGILCTVGTLVDFVQFIRALG